MSHVVKYGNNIIISSRKLKLNKEKISDLETGLLDADFSREEKRLPSSPLFEKVNFISPKNSSVQNNIVKSEIGHTPPSPKHLTIKDIINTSHEIKEEDYKKIIAYCEKYDLPLVSQNFTFEGIDDLQNIEISARQRSSLESGFLRSLYGTYFGNEHDLMSICVKRYKTELLLEIQKNITCLATKQPKLEVVKKALTRLQKIHNSVTIKKIMVILTSTTMLLAGSLGNFIGAKQLLGFIPGLSSGAILGISISLSAIESLIFLSFENSFVEESLGAKLWELHSISAIELDKIELETSRAIMRCLNLVLAEEPENRSTFHELRIKMKSILEDKKVIYKEEKKNPPYQKIIQNVVTGVGATMTVSGIYFGMNNIYNALFPGFAGTPAAWACLGVIMCAIFVLFLSLRAKGVQNMNMKMIKHNEMVNLSHNTLSNPIPLSKFIHENEKLKKSLNTMLKKYVEQTLTEANEVAEIKFIQHERIKRRRSGSV